MHITMQVEVSTLIVCTFSTVLLLSVAHWFPWLNPLRPIWAYTVYITITLTGFTAWRLLNGDWKTPAGLLILVAVSSITLFIAHTVDKLILAMRQARRAEAMDDELKLPPSW